MTDEATLRNLLREIKKEEIIFVKRNMATIVFPSLYTNPLHSSIQNVRNFDKILNHH